MDATSSHSNPLASRKRKLAYLNPSPEEATGHDSRMAIAETKKMKPIPGPSVSISRPVLFSRFADKPQPLSGTSLPPIGGTPLPLQATGNPPAIDAPPLNPPPLQLTAEKPEVQVSR